MQQSYDKIIRDYPDDRAMLMGDSAGGGLVLAFAQKLSKDKALIQPEKIILFSPWLALSMQNPAIKQQEKLDKILSLKALIDAGKKYSRGEDLVHYLLSPINGDCKNLGKILVFYGTDELFYPDCKKLEEKTKGFGNFSFREFKGMQHDWVIFPIPEAEEALEMAVEYVIPITCQHA
ncbi:MAG: alpha/beta hydrolase [Paludibacter sp.]|nr:alpha/beta hydrolase [Paludibacter sp.]